MIGIYTITHRETGCQYIGSSRDIPKRLGRHRTALRKGTHHCEHLQVEWEASGEASFDYAIRQVEDGPHVEGVLHILEQTMMDIAYRTPAGIFNSYYVARSAGGVNRIFLHAYCQAKAATPGIAALFQPILEIREGFLASIKRTFSGGESPQQQMARQQAARKDLEAAVLEHAGAIAEVFLQQQGFDPAERVAAMRRYGPKLADACRQFMKSTDARGQLHVEPLYPAITEVLAAE